MTKIFNSEKVLVVTIHLMATVKYSGGGVMLWAFFPAKGFAGWSV